MLQIHIKSIVNMKSPYDRLDIIMPSADKAEWFNSDCLKKNGTSGRLETGAPTCIME